jgi:hypothetical protein
VKQISFQKPAVLCLGLAAIAMILLIPGSGAALPLSGYEGVSLSGAGFGTVHSSSPSILAYSLPKSPLLSGGYSITVLNRSAGFITPVSGQIGTGGTSGSASGSSQLSGLFSNAIHNYYLNPPTPISNPSPSTFLTPALGTDTSWDAMFNPPVYHGCGCG